MYLLYVVSFIFKSFFISNNYFLAKTNENICLFSACFILEKKFSLFACLYIIQTGNVSTKYSFFSSQNELLSGGSFNDDLYPRPHGNWE